MRAALLEVEGVLAAEVDYRGGWARVTYDPAKVKLEKLPEALKGTRFTASLKSSGKKERK